MDGVAGTNGVDGTDGVAGRDGLDADPSDFYAGVSAAMAIAMIPQGEGLGIGGARYGNEGAYAVSYTKATRKMDFTVAVTRDSSRNTGFGVGVKYKLGRR
jgi:hypothetical protein